MRAALLVVALLACQRKEEPPDPPVRRPVTPPGMAGNVSVDRAEVQAVFAEVAVREEAMFAELGNYAGTGHLEVDFWPASAVADPPVLTAEWRALGAAPPERPRCRYLVLAGTDQEAVPGLMGQELFGQSIPGRHWWYALARCGDWVYGQANLSPAMRILRAGKSGN